jgi:signal transduction histidine kinase
VATAVVGLVLAAGGISMIFLLHQSQVADIEAAASLRATAIAGLIDENRLPNPIPVKTDDSAVVQVLDGAGRVVDSSDNVVGEPPVVHFLPKGTGLAAHTVHGLPTGDAGAEYRVVALRINTSAGSRVVYVATALKGVQTAVHQVGAILGLGLPLILAVVGITTWVMVGRALRPVDRIRGEVADISAGDLSRRVPEPGTADEVGRLAGTMNAMLERLQRASERQRRFVGDASHELRSPIAALRAQLEVTRTQAGPAWTPTDEAMLDEVLRMEGLIDNLLVLARSDSRPIRAQLPLMDLDDVVLGEVRRARNGHGPRVEVGRFDPARVHGDADEMARVIRNLLDNAVRHAATAARVELQTQAGDVVLAVSDDGPGIAPEERARIFDRFTRLDDARDRDHGGAGLGLAIVQDIVRAHDGTIEVEDGPEGGARFVVTFVLPPDS